LSTESNRSIAGSPNSGELNPSARSKLTVPWAFWDCSSEAQQKAPFKGTLQGSDTDIEGPDTAFVVATAGTGLATHLGRVSFTQQTTVDLTVGTDTGSTNWIAANGDSIDTTFVGSGEPTDSGLIRITEVHTIIAGTGRFAGVLGSFTVERLADPVAFVTSGSFHGTTTPPGAAH